MNLLDEVGDYTDIGTACRDYQSIDGGSSLSRVHGAVDFQCVDLAVSSLHIVADVRFGLYDRLGDIFVPGNRGDEIVLQCC